MMNPGGFTHLYLERICIRRVYTPLKIDTKHKHTVGVALIGAAASTHSSSNPGIGNRSDGRHSSSNPGIGNSSDGRHSSTVDSSASNFLSPGWWSLFGVYPGGDDRS
ncbi:hypothetical protein TNCV_4952321 [Trichonephila clavipes]|nr:hypothetical protein TNCV_4952321 [Trichonephila clavipes]